MRPHSAIWELTRVRVLLFWREPEAVFWVLVFPIVLVIVLALAFGGEQVKDVSVAVLAGKGDAALIEQLGDLEHVDAELVADEAEALRQLVGGEVEIVAVPGDPLVLRLDPDRPEVENARLRVVEGLQRAAGRVDPLAVEIRDETDTGARYVDWVFG